MIRSTLQSGGFGTALLTQACRVCFDDDLAGWGSTLPDEPDNDDGADLTPDPTPAAAADPAHAGAPPVAEPEWRQRFPGGEQAMWDAFRESERYITELRQQQQAAPPPPPEPVDPLGALPVHLDEHTYDRIVAAAQADLPATARAVWENREQFGEEVANQLMQAWAQNDLVGANRFLIENEREQLREELRSEYQQMIGPYAQSTTNDWVTKAQEIAVSEVDDFAVFQPRIGQMLEQNPQWLSGTYGDPEAMADRLVQMRDLLAAADVRAERKRAAAVAAASANGAIPPQAPRGAAGAPAGQHAARLAEIEESWDNTRVSVG